MEPIISPWWFYLFSIIVKIGKVAAIGIVASAIITILAIIAYLLSLNDYEEDAKKRYSKVLKYVIIADIVFGFIVIITPSPGTLWQMFIASMITPDNIASTLDTADKGIHYFIDINKEQLTNLANIIVDAAEKLQEANK